MNFAMMNAGMYLLRRREEGGGCGSLGCFVFLLILGAVIYFIMKGRRDKPEELGAAKRAMGSGPLADHSFACPYTKCPTCGASGEKMKQQWDGLRKVTWSCGYCGSQAGLQELKDEELPPSARQRLGLDAPPPAMMGGQGYGQGSSGGGMGDILTGMMIGNMLSGSDHHRDASDWSGGAPSDSGRSSDSSDWGDSSSGSGGDSGGDWGDSGGGDSSGGSDW